VDNERADLPPWPARSARYGDGPRWTPRRSRRSGHGAGAVIGAFSFHVFGNWSHATALPGLTGVTAAVLLLIGPAALVWRGRAPLPVLAVTAAASIAYAPLAPPEWTFAVAPVIALFTAARAGRGRHGAVIAGVALAAYLTVTGVLAGPLGVDPQARPTVRTAVLIAVALAITMFLGGASRARAAYFAEMTKANAERALAREEQERRQASDERLRIARELHDVLGHHLSLINVQAGVGLHLMDSRPEQAREALTAIKTASSEALREVRSVLAALRPEEEAAPRQPALGLDRLADLTADAGLPVTTSITGTPRPPAAEVDRAAYRIVQEALTNVRRHAAAGSAHIAVEYAPAELRLTIRNDGPAVPPPVPAAAGSPPAGGSPSAADPSGSGIAGMRARAESLGGTLTAGPLPEGGYLVSAVLPTTAAAAGENA